MLARSFQENLGSQMVLLTNSQHPLVALEGYGLVVIEERAIHEQ